MHRLTSWGRALALAAAAATIVVVPAGAQSPPAGAQPVDIAFIAGQIGITFYTGMECGAKAAADDLAVNLTWTGPRNWDINEQRPYIDAAVATEPQGWVIAPTDPGALIEFITAEMDAGRPVVTVDAPMSEPAELANIQSNHYRGGQLAAEEMIKLTNAEGSYLVLHLQPGLPDIGGRADGFKDAMETAGGTVLEYVYPGTDTSKASEAVVAAIAGSPDLKGIYATHESAGLGAAAGLVDQGQAGAIKLISFDSAPSQVADLKSGVYNALIAQSPYKMGYDSVKLVADTIRAGVIDPAAVEHDQTLDLAVITGENADQPEIAAFIYPADLNACPTGAPAAS